MDPQEFTQLLEEALACRRALLDERHETAVRLYNGFAEGCPDIVVDLYGETAVVNSHGSPSAPERSLTSAAVDVLRSRLPWLRAVLLKRRDSTTPEDRRGVLVHGKEPTRKIREHGIWYALDLTLHGEASFYLDTRNLRGWAIEGLKGKTVLNTFAYTGSLGVAALGGGAQRAVQLDRSLRFLNVAKSSYRLNGFPIRSKDFVQVDFFREAGRLRRKQQRFDCVFLDPPFFAVSDAGIVDLVGNSARLINKVRPLVTDGGYLVAVNNALYVSGAAYMRVLENLCAEGYLRLEELIPVPDDVVGYPPRRFPAPITDPAPFNHSTKIAILRSRA